MKSPQVLSAERRIMEMALTIAIGRMGGEMVLTKIDLESLYGQGLAMTYDRATESYTLKIIEVEKLKQEIIQ